MKKAMLHSASVFAGFVLVMALNGCSKEQPTAPAAPTASVSDAKPYPLDGCAVCEMKLSMMSQPVTFVYQGQQIKVCDAGEKSEFEKDPAKYMKKIQDANAALKK